MILGKMIYDLRKKKNVTQEELAAELGVTAAAVSKWEKGYTLPDILMLCALADYFMVTTDELLGRNLPRKYAIVAAEEEALGHKIVALAEKYGIHCRGFFTDYQAALDYEDAHTKEVQYMFTALKHPQEDRESNGNGVIHVDVHRTGGSDEDVLNGIELYLKNEEAFKNIADTSASMKK
jgi:transcriptional regulator with XRE-family HTH domain